MKKFFVTLSFALALGAVLSTSNAPVAKADDNSCHACSVCEKACTANVKGEAVYRCYRNCPCKGCAGAAL